MSNSNQSSGEWNPDVDPYVAFEFNDDLDAKVHDNPPTLATLAQDLESRTGDAFADARPHTPTTNQLCMDIVSSHTNATPPTIPHINHESSSEYSHHMLPPVGATCSLPLEDDFLGLLNSTHIIPPSPSKVDYEPLACPSLEDEHQEVDIHSLQASEVAGLAMPQIDCTSDKPKLLQKLASSEQVIVPLPVSYDPKAPTDDVEDDPNDGRQDHHQEDHHDDDTTVSRSGNDESEARAIILEDDLRDFDVFSHRGGKWINARGSRVFVGYIKKRRAEYYAKKGNKHEKREKARIIEAVKFLIQTLLCGRFLKPMEGKTGCYAELNDKEIVRKIQQCFRSANNRLQLTGEKKQERKKNKQQSTQACAKRSGNAKTSLAKGERDGHKSK